MLKRVRKGVRKVMRKVVWKVMREEVRKVMRKVVRNTGGFEENKGGWGAWNISALTIVCSARDVLSMT